MNPYQKKRLQAAYQFCRQINRAHYENFPVASFLLPAKLRSSVDAIYAFSRFADDFADEKEYEGVRLRKLKQWEGFLGEKETEHPVFLALQDTIQKHSLPISLFEDLLRAFRQDVEKKRYENFDEVLEYCRYSANPVGRLVLLLFGYRDEKLFECSDAICTGLQLANFWQDVCVDLEKNRIYLPREDLHRFEVSEESLFAKKMTKSFQDLMRFQVQRTRDVFAKGHALGLEVTSRLGVELRLTWLGGVEILNQLEANDFDVFLRRPKLKKRDFIRLFFIALSQNRYQNIKRRHPGLDPGSP